jgi:hypothetical protein
MDCPMAAGDITIDPRYLGCSPTPGGFPVAARNTIPRQEVLCDHQFSGHDDIKEAIPDGTPAAVTTSPGAAMYPPHYNQVPEAYSDHLVSGHSSSSSLVHSDVVLHALPAHQHLGNGLSTFRPLLNQTCQFTLSTTTGPIRGVGVDQHTSAPCVTLSPPGFQGSTATTRTCTCPGFPVIFAASNSPRGADTYSVAPELARPFTLLNPMYIVFYFFIKI